MARAAVAEEDDLTALLAEEDIDTLPVAEQVVARIDRAYASEPDGAPRAYIGASGIGSKCDAEIAFSLRGFPNVPPSPKLKRIFRDGHRIEREVIRDLKKAGYSVFEVDDLTGRQARWEIAGGHIVCNTDGQIDLEGKEDISLLEIKSMNDKNWTTFKRSSVKVSHPKYWDQMQMMMGMSGHKRCLFIAYNKNTSLYWAEVVEADPLDWSFQQTRIETVWRGEAKKVSDDPTGWLCRGCFKHGACWGGEAPERACRTCAAAAPIADGTWWCRRHKTNCAQPCADWEPYKPLDKS